MGNKREKDNKNKKSGAHSKSNTRTHSSSGSHPSSSSNAKSRKKKSKKGVKSKIWMFIKVVFLLFLMFAVVAAGIIVGMLYGVWGDDLDISEEELTITGNSVILDSKGKVIAELSGDENRKIITLSDMSEYLPKAYVAIEDERFYSHDGVDFKRTGGAILTYITHGGSSSYGGSTITQQLVKNITNDDAQDGTEGVVRKIKEWGRAYKIERMLSKDQILELYLNIIFVGSKYYGVETGSEYYFGKSAKDLSLVECAYMAGINNSPNAYNPYTDGAEYGKDDAKTEKINNRTKTVLGKMLELEYITQEQYDDACKEVDKGITFKKKAQIGSVYSYHTDAVISKVISDIAEEKGWTKEYATTYVYGGGLTIYSTQNTEVQEQMEKVMADNASKYQITSKATGKKSQAAMTLIDNDTGYVIAIVGGLGEKTDSRGLNRATQSPRQTGSSIKPIADLVPGINEGIITAATKYDDSATTFEGNFKPKNQGGYSGEISVRVATGKSKNIPFVKIMAEVTNAKSTEYMKNMGITTLDEKEDKGLAMAIGGLYNGISTFEMAAAYATIENDGVYRTPLLYTKVVDSSGKEVYVPEQETRKVFTEQTAYIVKDLLKSVVTASYGTASYCKISGIDVAAKTGTTNDDKDRWLCGFTDYYTAATWYGYDDPEEVKYSGTNPAGQIFSAVMKSVHKGKSKSTFKKPDGIVTAKICSKTGLKATDKCKSTYTEIFVKGTVPDECDEASSAVEICEDTNKLATEYCPNTKTEYYSYTLVKERLGLWKTSSSSKKAPTEVCTEHNEQNYINNYSDAPKITLKGKSKITLKVGETYTEEGATATDGLDGDITNKIITSGSVNTSKAGTYTVKYTVTNSKGKTTTLTRTIEVQDTSTNTSSVPKITLKGSSSITLKVGDTYTDEGATATDDLDGDITSKIKTSGSVNTSKAGTYTITYTVTNTSGKTATTTRTVKVEDTGSSSNNPEDPGTGEEEN